MGDFSQTVSDLATSDLGKSVSHSLEALAELERNAQETESAQARADQTTLLSTADEYARLVNSVRVSIMVAFHASATGADLSTHRWHSVRVFGYTTHGRMQTQSSAGSSRRTNATAHKARPLLTVSGTHILKLARYASFSRLCWPRRPFSYRYYARCRRSDACWKRSRNSSMCRAW